MSPPKRYPPHLVPIIRSDKVDHQVHTPWGDRLDFLFEILCTIIDRMDIAQLVQKLDFILGPCRRKDLAGTEMHGQLVGRDSNARRAGVNQHVFALAIFWIKSAFEVERLEGCQPVFRHASCFDPGKSVRFRHDHARRDGDVFGVGALVMRGSEGKERVPAGEERGVWGSPCRVSVGKGAMHQRRLVVRRTP